MSTEQIVNIEKEIDEAFSKSPLLDIGYTQAVWTLLSVVEDHHWKIQVYKPLDQNSRAIYADGLLNALTYPLRVCHKKNPDSPKTLKRFLIEEDYEAASEWIDRAEDYTHFCSIFPLYHNREISLQVAGNSLITTSWLDYDLSYEAYDRFIKKHNSKGEKKAISNAMVPSILASTSVKNDTFSLNFNPKLVKEISSHLKASLDLMFSLPEEWMFTHFSIADFKIVFTTIQSLAYGWFIARQIACQKGVAALGFNSSLWTPHKTELIARLIRYTGLTNEKMAKIIEYLTFGEAGIRNPDIAIQPIVDLRNGEYGISPFVWLNVNCERNLCVLLNQIEEEKNIYSQLVNSKENKLRQEIIQKLSGLEFVFKFGQLGDTDIDLAIIDHKTKKCLTLELKWFIEPAEVREVIQRSKEIKKGVIQAQKIMSAWQRKDDKLVNDILGIDASYDLLSVVASVNSIGNASAQDSKVPIIKTWHLVDEIIERRNLGQIMGWLKNKDYLPKRNIDFEIKNIEIQSGKWLSTWYGITYI
ncbi:MAG: hypothetical protein OT477_04210 [Chloroflexi bacterium]|nr:hypothetical protein [Chloroflexota bacterium]